MAKKSRWKNIMEKEYRIQFQNLVLVISGLLGVGSLLTVLEPMVAWVIFGIFMVLGMLRITEAKGGNEK